MKAQIPKVLLTIEYLYNNPELGKGAATFGAIFSMATLFSCAVLYHECDRKLVAAAISNGLEAST